MISCEDTYRQASDAIKSLIERAEAYNPVKLLVIGCSSSEIAGGTIGHDIAYELGQAVAKAALDLSAELGFACAFQCCEHLNRALVMEEVEAEGRGYEPVCVVPHKRGGGSLATAAYGMMKRPVLVEQILADAGIDIGQTLIGMHLRRVAVPVRLPQAQIGGAIVTAARTRPKLIGGERARYRAEIDAQ